VDTFLTKYYLLPAEASGNGLNHLAKLRPARKNLCKKSFSLIAEYLLNKARTHFSKNSM